MASVDEINEFLEELHALAEDDAMPDAVDDEEDYTELVTRMESFMQGMPKYKSAARNEIVELPSLLGAFGQLFLRLEDAYLDLAEMGASGKKKPEEIIRIHAFDISMAIFKYVSKATVHAEIATTTVGLASPIVTGSPTAPTFGTGAGKGKGKLS